MFAAIRRGGLSYATGVSRRIIFAEDRRRLKNRRRVISARKTTVLPTIFSPSLSSARNRDRGRGHALRNRRGKPTSPPHRRVFNTRRLYVKIKTRIQNKQFKILKRKFGRCGAESEHRPTYSSVNCNKIITIIIKDPPKGIRISIFYSWVTYAVANPSCLN